MKTLKTTITLLLVAISSITYAQSLVLTEEDVEFIHITNINKTNAEKGIESKSDIKSSFTGNAVSDNGMMVINDKLISNLNLNPQAIDLPRPATGIVKPLFSIKNNELFYWDLNDSTIQTIHLYDILQNKIIKSQTFNTSLSNSFGYHDVSRNGSTLFMETRNYLTLLEYIDGEFVKKSEIGPRTSFSYLEVSKLGTRIFYNVKRDELPVLVYVEKTEEGWSEEKFVEIPPYSVNGLESPRIKTGIANDGKTIITSARYNITNSNISVIHEENGKWSEPENVGEVSQIVIPDQHGGGYVLKAKIYNSEDGRVIAVQQPRGYYPWNERVESYDILVFVKDDDGQWNKIQINSPEIGAIGSSDILLSPNGEQLYWIPQKSISSVTEWGKQ